MAERTATQAGTRRAPTVVEGTAPSRSEEAQRAFEEAIAATHVDERVWTGAFATNVWAGRYAVEGVLGQGGQGCTLHGTDLKTGARVAVKVLDLAKARDWKALELFDREVAALKAVEHPGLPAFLDVIADETTGARAIVMSLVPGEDLDRVVRTEGPLGEAAIWRALVDVTDVLSSLHGRASPLVHRDVKPRNLVRRPDGRIAVVDLGGVGHVKGAAGSTVVGTFGYMAPEQLYGTHSPATDLYALGATMLTLATGKEPEDQPRTGLALDVDRAAPHLSEPLRGILRRLLAPDPTQRPADARALLAELKALAEKRDEDRRPKQEPRRVLEQDLEQELEGRPPEEGIDDAALAIQGILQILVGVGGAVAVVAVGQILLPLLFSVLASFSVGAQKQRLLALRSTIEVGAKSARVAFLETARRGAAQFEEIDRRDKARKAWRKRSRKEHKRLAREARERAKQARRKGRRGERFWAD